MVQNLKKTLFASLCFCASALKFCFPACLLPTLISLALVAEEPQPHETILIPMRDGTELPADIYYPKDYHLDAEKKPLPCILIRNPSGKSAPQWLPLAALADAGYVVVFQSSRSAIDQEGKSLPYWSDGWGIYQDGYDTVQWLAESPYTNGLVGTVGFSAAGITQLLMAPTAPPALKCQHITVAAASLYHHALYNGGQFLKNQVENWLGLYAPDPGVLHFVRNQPFLNDFWKGFDSTRVASRVNTPGVHVGGWFDTFLQGTLEGFDSRQNYGGEGARGAQKLVIGPWEHSWPVVTTIGDFNVPVEGRALPVDLGPVRWFARYLKGEQNGIEKEPAVTYYVMGPFDGSPSSGNVWRHADQWPVPAQFTPFYLTADKSLETSLHKVTNADLSYPYDPKNPVPTIGGRNLFLPAGPKDQHPIESREDVLVFTTDPLEEDLEVTGVLKAKLYFAADAESADLAVRLTDVYPDGRSILIADGLTRVQKPANISSLVEVDLASTSIVFAKGHRIRVILSGSNYPRFEKNTNVGMLGRNKSGQVAVHALSVGEKTPSHLLLPVVRKGNTWLNEDHYSSGR